MHFSEIIKGPPSTDRLFDRLFLLWKFALLIAAIQLDEFQIWLDLFRGMQCLSVEGGPLSFNLEKNTIHCFVF